MSELFVALMIIYIGYLLQRLIRTAVQTGSNPSLGAVVPLKPREEVRPPPAVVAPGPAPGELVAEKAAEPKAPARSRTGQGRQLKNPLTGETCPLPASYRFAKKWVKEAMVTEGLLDRVYKTSELDETVTAQVRQALTQLGQMTTYQG